MPSLAPGVAGDGETEGEQSLAQQDLTRPASHLGLGLPAGSLQGFITPSHKG